MIGSDFQPTGHVHYLTNLIDFGMDPQAALDAPRVFFSGDMAEIERGVRPDVIAVLQAKGHRTLIAEDPLGGGQGILIDWQAGTHNRGLGSAQGRLRAGVLDRPSRPQANTSVTRAILVAAESTSQRFRSPATPALASDGFVASVSFHS
jgi:hypothetical protein